MAVNIITIGDGFHGTGAADFNALIGSEASYGDILAGISEKELSDLAPQNGEPVFMTRSPFNGNEIALAKAAVARLLAEFLRGRQSEPSAIDLVWCSGRFDLGNLPNNLLFPSDLVLSGVRNVLRDGLLGVLMPLEAQRKQMHDKWKETGFDIVSVPLLPGATRELVEQAANELARFGPSLVVMDCMIYDMSAKQTVKRILDVPVILPATICARTISELS